MTILFDIITQLMFNLPLLKYLDCSLDLYLRKIMSMLMIASFEEILENSRIVLH